MPNYNEKVSIAKEIGIIAVVVSHVATQPEPFPFQPYSFHMPLFFFLSGQFFRPNDGILSFMGRKVRSLLLPYFAYNLLFRHTDLADLEDAGNQTRRSRKLVASEDIFSGAFQHRPSILSVFDRLVHLFPVHRPVR